MALTSSEIMFWQAILAIGAVVIVAVIALLGLLLRLLSSIDNGVRHLDVVAHEVAKNTANIKVALTVMGTLDEVVDEADHHAQLLGLQAR